MDIKALSCEQCWSIGSYLRTAAGQFKTFREQMEQHPGNPQLAEQFEKQRKEADALATLFENADSAKVFLEE